jgi:hypothetical protein
MRLKTLREVLSHLYHYGEGLIKEAKHATGVMRADV